jgi:hypothetical protein
VGAAARTIRYWADRERSGALRAEPATVDAAVKEYAARIGIEDFRPLPKVKFSEDANPAPQRAILPEAPRPTSPLALVGASEPHPGSSRDPEGEPAGGFAPLDPFTLATIYNPPASSSKRPSDDALAVAALLGAEMVEAVPVSAPPEGLDPDVQKVAASYGSQAVWHMAAIATAMGEHRLPSWQLDQLKTASGIWAKIAALAAPRPKAAEYQPPRASSPVPKKLGDALVFLGDLLEQVTDPRELEALESLIRKVSAGEVGLEPPREPMQ